MTLLAAVLAQAAVAAAFLSYLRTIVREHARERNLLINQLLHATGKPWQPAPADEPADEPDRPRTRYTATPEQYPA